MPNANKETVQREINILETDNTTHPDLNSYYPDNDDRSFQSEDHVDGFTSFLNRIEARKVRVKSRIFPEDSN